MFASLPLTAIVAVFAASALIIAICGVIMTGRADTLADRTGLGEAMVGAVVLGAATSLSGTVVSVSAALDGRASLAFSNSVGGIAAQTAFLAIADMTFRRANLEHAAAEATNLIQGVLLIFLLALPVAAMAAPEVTIWAVHPVSFAIPLIYVFGLAVSRRVREDPMWKPVRTPETRHDTPDEEDGETARKSTLRLTSEFLLLMAAMGLAGYAIAQSASTIIDRIGVSASLVGALMTAVATSLPELVTTIAAVRRGALQLAVGGIIGGNMFDTLFLTLADTAYRDGSLYHAATDQDFFWVAVAVLMTAALLAGLITRERHGPVRMGIDSIGLLGIYAIAIAVQLVL
ncbi:hypothetical protein OB2597_12261 [Pseudooceanicola batsensis HTCC2597]|uniref:Sodium/calcium exchanger membrane region domain-containing protein n=1 Tax=Pseudooceanicola batsensis (strain ATCC BAA-863 / DSM 15984 / KCTC 12145 / HTCC2597) TaxID=252305 RepID=A3TWM2_PSEBH|nr:cation transporter [Pseudooceanicola batsensis]EAQ04018.1 hypothetical protein OB2597_12261 [Pseudooceanicola batsensis HTCC2597]